VLPTLIVVRNESDARRLRDIVEGSSPCVVALARLLYTDFDEEKVVFSKNTSKTEEAVRESLQGLKYELAVVDCEMSELPAERLADFAKERSCKEIIVLGERFDRNLPYANNLGATLAVVSEVPVRVMKP
jgi:hypothetical protein